MFNLNQLPLTSTTVNDLKLREVLKDDKLIIFQHLRSDTEAFIKIINESCSNIIKVLGKPNSVDEQVKKNIQNMGISVEVHPYEKYENKEEKILDSILEESVQKIKSDLGKVLIIEVGGYFSGPLSRLSSEKADKVGGIIEITQRGYKKYLNYQETGGFKSPIISLANTKIKNVEAEFVAQAGIEAINMIFREYGKTISYKDVGLIGFGMINSHMAKGLKNNHSSVSTYDIATEQGVYAEKLGVNFIKNREEFLGKNKILISATGNTSLSIDDIEQYCQNGTFLIAMGSRGEEFPIKEMNNSWVKKEGKNITKYITPKNGKEIFVLNSGIAMNYMLKSCPSEVMDPYFTEMLYALKSLKENNLSKDKIHIPSGDDQEKIYNLREIQRRKI